MHVFWLCSHTPTPPISSHPPAHPALSYPTTPGSRACPGEWLTPQGSVTKKADSPSPPPVSITRQWTLGYKPNLLTEDGGTGASWGIGGHWCKLRKGGLVRAEEWGALVRAEESGGLVQAEEGGTGASWGIGALVRAGGALVWAEELGGTGANWLASRIHENNYSPQEGEDPFLTQGRSLYRHLTMEDTWLSRKPTSECVTTVVTRETLKS